ncbi:putative bifunctional diguanylate cyclase/phosphodiesterase [Paractinoplanes rishiriensis]|uniref:Diguanylate cyclase/phosphodiesterase n=1 Tax=Paractinoplanes rishiriensis TaxID=1050105 RepID=A0A919K4A3_9ACTN|nr:bifunctional diguanylate cyclase/phosphodiesterase [Actinoplanes rishiriensis]GIF00637.1 hypothetical protein Ari01nite_81010 [Actinoplanes rishiriensis]
MQRARLWLRGNALAASGVLVLLAGTAWLLIGLAHEWAYPVIGWLPVVVAPVLALYACWLVARKASLDPGTRRFWRHITVAMAFYVPGSLANLVDAVGGPEPSQRIGPVALVCYLGTLVVVMWALLRLPSWQRTRGDWIRFGLDTCVVLVTSGAFVWHFSIRDHEAWQVQTGSTGPVLAIIGVAFVAVITFVKVAFAGAGRLDRRALHFLALGATASTLVGGLTPFLSDHPYLSTTMISIPVSSLGVLLAALRQLSSDGRLPRPRRQRMSVVPYVAVAGMAILLLSTSETGGTESTILKCAAVTITFLVMARQIVALRENRRLQHQLTHQATHDPLTGVANRALFERHVEHLLASNAKFHVALLDIDEFKATNDRFGHHTGDRLLVIVSHRLTAAVGPRGMVARLGGDEFALILPESDTAGVESVLTGMVTVLREAPQLNGATIGSVASIGVTAGQPGDTPEDLLRRADVAMYAAKGLGGDRWHWFDPAMDEMARETARLNADLRRALADDEFFLLYQPIVDLPSHRPAGVEALLRWRHPERGLVAPDVFIPLAERSGLIVELGRWVLENACRQAAEWQTRYGGNAPAKVSINVSARQLAEPDFVETVDEIISRTGVDRSRLMLEVTETAVLAPGPGLEAIHRLRANGLRVALDDFGTGQSSLSLLLNCPVDVLKVDRSFVSGNAADHAGAVIVENLIGFTNGLHIEAIAEGVETREQAGRLFQAGYRLAQGYLFGRPMSAEDIEAQLDATAGTIVMS